MRRSARNYANVAGWLLRSRFCAVVPTVSVDVAVVPTRSAISPAGPLCPSSSRCPSFAQKRVDAKRVLCWTGAMQLCDYHSLSKRHRAVDDSLHRRPHPLKHTADYAHEMRRLLREDSYPHILDLFEEMKSRRITANVIVYTVVMKAHSWMKNVDMVTRVFNESMTSRIKPDKFLFNTLIFSYANAGDVDAAFEAFHKMQKDYSIPPNPVAYRSLITVCGKGKDVDRARETFNEMMEKLRTVDVRNFNVMLEVYAENADRDTGEAYLRECKELMAAMKSKGIKPEAFTYVPLIKLCGKLGRSDKALHYLKKSVSRKVKLTVPFFDFVIGSLADLQLTDEELETHIIHCFDRMTKFKMLPSYFTFRAIIDLYEARGDASMALGFLTKLSKTRMDIGIRGGDNFAAQLETVQRLWESGKYSQEEALAKTAEVLETMKSLRISLSNRGYKTWFTMCLKASDVERALFCWNHFTRRSRWPSAGMTQSMIRLALDHGRADDAVRALKYVQKMVRNGNENMLIEDTYETILAHCAAENDTMNARTIFACMKEAKVKPNTAIRKHLGVLQLA